MNIPEAEREAHLAKYRGMLDHADEVVWSQPWFPQDHRPDITSIKAGLAFGTEVIDGFVLHPLARTSVRKSLEDRFVEADRDVDRNKIAMCYPSRHVVQLRPPMLMSDDSEVRRILFHEAATDVFSQAQIITPDEYTPRVRTRVKNVLRIGFPKGSGVNVDQTRVEKIGFRRVLKLDEYFLTDLVAGPAVAAADEIYPTIVELITEELMNGVDIDTFEREVAEGTYQMKAPNQHPKFTDALIGALRFIDWRDLLQGFMCGDLLETVDYLNKTVKDPQHANGIGIVKELLFSMEKDEKRIENLNSLSQMYLGM